MNDTENRFKHQSIIVKLGKIRIINYIEILLMDKDARSYSYYIDVSLDGIEYKRLIDHTAHYCRSWQFLFFPSRPVQFIKLVGTRIINQLKDDLLVMEIKDGRKSYYHGTTFGVFDLEAVYVADAKATEAIFTPNSSIATTEMGAIVIEGAGGNNMLNSKLHEFTCHERDQGRILLQLNQPYKIDSIRMLLGNDQNYLNQYSFYIETSMDNVEWQMAVDKRNEVLSGWQTFQFEERPVSFIKIIGTKPDIVSLLMYT